MFLRYNDPTKSRDNNWKAFYLFFCHVGHGGNYLLKLINTEIYALSHSSEERSLVHAVMKSVLITMGSWHSYRKEKNKAYKPSVTDT